VLPLCYEEKPQNLGEIRDLWAKIYIFSIKSLLLAASGSKLVFEKSKKSAIC